MCVRGHVCVGVLVLWLLLAARVNESVGCRLAVCSEHPCFARRHSVPRVSVRGVVFEETPSLMS